MFAAKAAPTVIVNHVPVLTWYFDFLSPFAYLQTHRFGDLPEDADLIYKPVLFAGLLGHWDNKGPAEIPPKRVFTYRYVQWFADKHHIPYRIPPAHPFNPLKSLRLCIALGCGADAVTEIFRFIWAEGRAPDNDAEWQALCRRLGVTDGDARVSTSGVKDALRNNTEEAAARGVFGVPTFETDGKLFWGLDATDMLLDYLARPGVFETEEMRRVSALPVGVERLKH